MKHLLVTGGCGFIGSSFVHQSIEAGFRVTNLDALTYAGSTANLQGLKKPENYTFVHGRVEDGELVRKLLKENKFDAVVHFAAESHVDRSITGPAAFIESNIVGTFNLLQSSLEHWRTLTGTAKEAFRFVQVSTDEVYGTLGETGYFTEDSKYLPNSPYSASKAAGDLLARAWFHTYGFPVITTNCSNNYGPRQFPEKLIPRMITCALEHKPLPVYGTGANVRDWIHVEDHARGVRLAMEKGRRGDVYLFGGRAERRNIDVVKTLCRAMDELHPWSGHKHEELVTFVEDRLGHDHRYAIDDTKSEKELGFKRAYDFESGLLATVRWYLDNGKWLEQIKAKGS